jgi:hypothetical protein
MEKEKKKYDITKNPAYITGRRLLDEREVLRKQADAQAIEATKKASKGEKYEGYVTDLGYPDIRQINPSSPRQLTQNKSRGTNSSSVRRIIK